MSRHLVMDISRGYFSGFNLQREAKRASGRALIGSDQNDFGITLESSRRASLSNIAISYARRNAETRKVDGKEA